MCGLVGIFSYQINAPKVNREELIKIRDHMSKRGPDGKGEWFSNDDCVALGHRRLSIIDLSDSAAQPMVSNCGQVIIIYNGEIYNYKELREKLVTKGYKFKSNSDTEVLINLYLDKGEDMVEYLRGMFAFAIWDERRRGMFLVRDHFGIKPLYISDDGKTVRFASQVKALLAGDRISRELDPAGQVGFYLWGHIPEPFTLYKNIRSVPSGTSIFFDSHGNKNENKYFSITDTFVNLEKIIKEAPKKSNQTDLREIMLDTVRHHLVSDVPVGLFLSSGLDSITLTALASELQGNLKTVTLGFEEFKGTENDETIYAEKVARQYGTDHQTIWISKKDFQCEKENILDVMDQPSIDGVNSYFVAKAAAEAGLKVAISGIGGDEIYGGYSSFKQIPKLVNLISKIKLIPGIDKAFHKITSSILNDSISPKYAGLIEYGGSFSSAYFMRRAFFMPWELGQILDEAIINEGLLRLKTDIKLTSTINGIQDSHLKISALETNWYMRNQLLRDSDWAGMAHSLEIRVPFVDLVNVQQTAIYFLNNNHISKRDLAQTPLNALDKHILYKRKSGFSVPIKTWLENEGNEKLSNRGLRGWANCISECNFMHSSQ